MAQHLGNKHVHQRRIRRMTQAYQHTAAISSRCSSIYGGLVIPTRSMTCSGKTYVQHRVSRYQWQMYNDRYFSGLLESADRCQRRSPDMIIMISQEITGNSPPQASTATLQCWCRYPCRMPQCLPMSAKSHRHLHSLHPSPFGQALQAHSSPAFL